MSSSQTVETYESDLSNLLGKRPRENEDFVKKNKKPCIDVTHPEIATQWHPTKNEGKLPSEFTYGNSSQKFWWICPKTCPEGCIHEWKDTISNRCKNRGCPFCSKHQLSCKHVSIEYTHPEITTQWHPTKNEGKLPFEFTSGSSQKVWWICPKTCPEGCIHEWQAPIHRRCGERKAGCPYCCKNRLRICKHVSIEYTHPEIASEWHPTKNEGNPFEFTAGSDKKIWWICSKNPLHEWDSTIGSRCLLGTGCPRCPRKRPIICESDSIQNTHPEIAAQWHPTKNKGILPSEFTFGSGEKVWWICPKTCPEGCIHEWQALISSRCGKQKAGCPYCCQNPSLLCKHFSIEYTHPEVLVSWHPTKNEGKVPSEFASSSHDKIWWICPKTCPEGCIHEWQASIHNRCGNNSGCPFCSKHQLSCKHVSIEYTHPEIAAQWHPTKNEGKLPSEFTSGCRENVWWICSKTCPEGCLHEWQAPIYSRCGTQKTGCPYCCRQKICKHVSIEYTHPEIAVQWHPTKNEGKLPSQFFYGSGEKVWWICSKTCPEGCPHEYKASFNDRCGVKKQGCPFCCRKQWCEHVSMQYTHPEIAAQWHPTKNEGKLPSQFLSGHNKKYWWICSKNPLHEWKAAINERCGVSKTGCPFCINKTEAKLMDYLKLHFPDTTYQYRESWCMNPNTNRHLPFDFFIPSKKMIIELDGPQHFRQISNWQSHAQTTRVDVFKMKRASDHGISTLRLVQEEVIDASPEWMDENVLTRISCNEIPKQVLFSSSSPEIYEDHLKLLASDFEIFLDDFEDDEIDEIDDLD